MHTMDQKNKLITNIICNNTITLEESSSMLTTTRAASGRERSVVENVSKGPCDERLGKDIWCSIQILVSKAKSLGDIAKVTMAFFKEHELAIAAKTGCDQPGFPIAIPAQEVYHMLVARKRRIYDVLHVFEGIGIIKRMRCDGDFGPPTRGGYFLYYGKDAAIQRLISIKDKTQQVVIELHQEHGSWISMDEIDEWILKLCENEGVAQKWPSLTTITLSFLSILLGQTKGTAIALPGISNRLVMAKNRMTSSTNNQKNATVDVNRRIYDVVSVLASCELVLTSTCPEVSDWDLHRNGEKIQPRKHVRFNSAIFNDPNAAKIADVSVHELLLTLSSVNSSLQQIENATFLNECILKRKRLEAHSLQANTVKNKSTRKRRRCKTWSIHQGKENEDTENENLNITNISSSPTLPNLDIKTQERINMIFDSNNCLEIDDQYIESSVSVQGHQTEPIAISMTELYTMESNVTNTGKKSDLSWWNDSLKDLTFSEAVATTDNLDWELLKSNGDDSNDIWGNSTLQKDISTSFYDPISFIEMDLKCHEDPNTLIDEFLV